MSDAEKLALIANMIGDFWEYHDAEAISRGAEVFVTAINSVLEFKGVSDNG